MEKVKKDKNGSNKQQAITEEELNNFKLDLDKHVQKEDKLNILNILKLLEKKNITSELLRQTKIGKTINQIKNQYNDSSQEDEKIINKLSSELVSLWKEIYQKDKKQDNQKDSQKKKKYKQQKESQKEEQQYIESQIKDDDQQVQYEKLDQNRQSIVDLYVKVLKQHVTKENLDEKYIEKVELISRDIEKLLKLNYPIEKTYFDKARSILYNLRDQKNKILRQRLLDEEIQPFDLISCQTKDLASEEKKKQIEQVLQNNLDARRTDWIKEEMQKEGASGKNKGFFKCFKCQSNNTTYYQLQTRGGDEPMTNFINCLECGNQWKN